jgi:deoxyinosine 3'endonuclease (endonuclease V)
MQTMVENLINFPMMAAMDKLIEKPTHPWDLKPPETAALQVRLSRRVVRQSRINFGDIDTVTVAGVDIGYRKDTARVAVVVRKVFNELCVNHCEG